MQEPPVFRTFLQYLFESPVRRHTLTGQNGESAEKKRLRITRTLQLSFIASSLREFPIKLPENLVLRKQRV